MRYGASARNVVASARGARACRHGRCRGRSPPTSRARRCRSAGRTRARKYQACAAGTAALVRRCRRRRRVQSHRRRARSLRLQHQADVRRQHAAVAMQQRERRRARPGVAPARPVICRCVSTRCAIAPPTPQWPYESRPPCSVERHRAVGVEVAFPRQRAGPAARRQADLLEQDRQRDGEAVVDRGRSSTSASVRPASARACAAHSAGAELGEAGGGADVLCVVPLRGRGDANAGARPSRSRRRRRRSRRPTPGSSRGSSAARRSAARRARPSTVIGSRNCAPACCIAWRRISTASAAKSGLGAAELVHVARRDQAVVGGNGRAERHLVDRVADLRQRLHRRVAALAGHPVLAADDEDALAPRPTRPGACASITMREAGRAAELHGVRVARAAGRSARRTPSPASGAASSSSSRRRAPSTSPRSRPASASARSVASLIRSSVLRPSCRP